MERFILLQSAEDVKVDLQGLDFTTYSVLFKRWSIYLGSIHWFVNFTDTVTFTLLFVSGCLSLWLWLMQYKSCTVGFRPYKEVMWSAVFCSPGICLWTGLCKKYSSDYCETLYHYGLLLWEVLFKFCNWSNLGLAEWQPSLISITVYIYIFSSVFASHIRGVPSVSSLC